MESNLQITSKASLKGFRKGEKRLIGDHLYRRISLQFLYILDICSTFL